MAKKATKALKTLGAEPGGYVMLLRSVGNPDHGQYAPVSEPAAVRGPTLESMRAAAEAYIRTWDLGGGNWPSTEIRTADGKAAAWVSYNGRLWDRSDAGDGWKTKREVGVL